MPKHPELDALNDPDPQVRIRAIRRILRDARAEDWDVWQRLEWLALYDRDPLVRQVALSALLSPEGQKYYERWLPTLTLGTFRSRLQEVERLKAEGVVDPAAAEVILDFYRQHAPEEPPPVPPARPEAPAEPAAPPPQAQTQAAAPQAGAVWMQVLVYIGAFLVASAALLLARIPGLRLPVLWGGTFLFFLIALGLWFVFRPGASVFYGLATFFLWADVYVLVQEVFRLPRGPAFHLAMALTTLTVGLFWVLGTWLFRSGWFALLTAAAMPVGALWLTFALFPTPENQMLFGPPLTQAMLTVLWVWVWVLRRKQPELAAPPRYLLGVVSTLHSLFAVGWMIALRFLGDVPLPQLRVAATLNWIFLVVFFLTALRVWPVPLWDGAALTWTLYWFAFALGLPQPALETRLAVTVASIGLVYGLVALPLSRVRGRAGASPWPWWVSGWLLLVTGALLSGVGQRAVISLLLMAGALVYAIGSGLRRHRLLAGGAALLFVFGYGVAQPLWEDIWQTLGLAQTRAEARLWQGSLLLLLLGVAALALRGPWAWSVVLPGLLPALGLWVEALDQGKPVGLLALLVLAFVLLLWSWATRWPYWVTLALGVALVAHAQALPEAWQGYWPVTYLPYPPLYLALEQGLTSYFPQRLRFWQRALRPALWGYTAILALPALGVENFSGPVFVALTGAIYLASVFLHRTPWPGIGAAAALVMALGRSLELAGVSDVVRWVSGAFGLVGLGLFLLFRRYGRPRWAAAWAVVGQVLMYFTAYGYWLGQEGRLGAFAWLFVEILAGLLVAAVFRSGAWLWTSVAALVIAVATLLVGTLGGVGALALIGCSGLLLLAGGLYVLYRRSRRTEPGS